MRRYIVITSIFDPTEAVKKFSKLEDYKVIVVGDNKSPKNWECKNVEYLSIDKQEKLDFSLSKILPYNHYCRKMIGYLTAIKNGADFIIDTDDDNIPKDNWFFPDLNGDFDSIDEDMGFVNIYELYTNQKIWARGLPLNLVNKKFNLEGHISIKNVEVGVWQGLADEDPDVDAIYRLTNDAPCLFNERSPIVLGKNTISPFNTQNTLIRKELFPLMYLPTYVTFRYTDILRGLVAQPIMWLNGYQLGFINATVIQKRNPHDYMKDFISEIPMYKSCESVIEIVTNSISASESVESNLYSAYESLLKKDIIPDKEMKTLDAWLRDIQHLSK